MRKTLASVVKDVSPVVGRPNPLMNSTMQDIKDCLGSITEREAELTGKFNINQAKPYYADASRPISNGVSFTKLPK